MEGNPYINIICITRGGGWGGGELIVARYPDNQEAWVCYCNAIYRWPYLILIQIWMFMILLLYMWLYRIISAC